MSELYSAEAAPRLFVCGIYRNKTKMPGYYMPDAPAVLIAGEEMLRAAGYVPGSNRPRGWTLTTPGVFTKPSCDGQHVLRVRQCGKFWIIERLVDSSPDADQVKYRQIEVLVFIFGLLPIWTCTYQAAMHLAQHCDPRPCAPVAAYWVKGPRVVVDASIKGSYAPY